MVCARTDGFRERRCDSILHAPEAHRTRSPLNPDPLDLVERDLVVGAIVELGPPAANTEKCTVRDVAEIITLWSGAERVCHSWKINERFAHI